MGEGLPCDVVALLQSDCWTCHGTTPYSLTPIKLLTYADMIAPSATSPSETNAELSVFRMQNLLSPMPPGPYGATASQVAVLQAWISAGYPTSAACDPPGADPYAAPPRCGSGQPLDPNQEESPDMNPGRACNVCHNFVNNEGSTAPIFAFAGTVFPSAHEPDECLAPASTGAMVEVTDDLGVVTTVPVTASGNFSFDDLSLTFTPPYTARVLFQGRVRPMATPQVEGDCNTCHNQPGNTDAPGRILLP